MCGFCSAISTRRASTRTSTASSGPARAAASCPSKPPRAGGQTARPPPASSASCRRARRPPRPPSRPYAETPAPTAPVEKAYLGADGLAVAPASAPPEVQAIIAAGNAIATAPYKYGGGHGRWVDSGYDCSGSVSYVLHAAGLLDTALDSSGFMDWGEPGRGTWVTIRSNPGHAYLIVAGLRFDTSARRATGNRWSAQMRSARGYTARHPEGL